MSYFTTYKQAQTDPIFGLNAILKGDKRKNLIDLLIGYYKDETGNVPIFNAVKQAQDLIKTSQKDLNYLPIDGLDSFVNQLKSLIFSETDAQNVYGAQSVGGTGALHHLGKLLSIKKGSQIAIPSPTWVNHNQIFEYLGMKISTYPYYDKKNNTLLWNEFLIFLNEQPSGAIILFHASCHNPSGMDFSNEQWSHIAQICKNKNLFPFFDCAYQGLGHGIEEDIGSIKIFCDQVDEFFLAYSCSKNFGLYGERTGALFYYSKNKQNRDIVASILKQSIRATYSNPPRHGALIVNEILKNRELMQNWKIELHSYKERICYYRKKYKQALEKLTGKDFAYVENGNGLFVFTGLDEASVKTLRENEAIYLSSDGRLNLTGLNQTNFDYVMQSISRYL